MERVGFPLVRDFNKEPLHFRYRPIRFPDQKDSFIPDMPLPPEALIEFLEQEFPARCRLRGEDELEHERYAGKVELIAALRDRLEAGHEAEAPKRMEVTTEDVHVSSTKGAEYGDSPTGSSPHRSSRGAGNRRSA